MPSLTWLTRDDDLKRAGQVPYCLLEEVPELSCGDRDSGNMLIQGDNLDALKALLPYYKGRVKCIFIDPPYNTGSAFEHYDDNMEHTKWLSVLQPRLEILASFLSDDGFFLCQIDDSQGPYLKVLCDEIFSRSNFEMTFYVQVRYPQKTLKQDMNYHKQIEQVFAYRSSEKSKPNQILFKNDDLFEKFKFSIEELGSGRSENIGGKNVRIYLPNEYRITQSANGWVDGLKEIWATGSILDGNSSGRFFRDFLAGRSEADGLGVLYKVENIGDDGLGFRYFTGPKKKTATKGKYFQGVPVEKRKVESGEVAQPIPNFHDFAGAFGNCRLEGGADFRSGKKPEVWISYLLDRFTNRGDLVLDSFLGSGTTAAVAQKMGRKWIGVEMGDHAVTHCAPRLRKVIEGEQGGISKVVEWQGGGGFRFYRLGEPVFDDEGRIRPGIKFPNLAAHVWFSETGQPYAGAADSPFLGNHAGRGFALLYNGILGDKRVTGGNVLTSALLASVRELAGHDGPLTIYGEASRIGAARLKAEGVTFKQTPYDVKAR